MLKPIRYVLLVAGILIGIYHLKLVGRAIFVFTGDEPLSLWIFLCAGPLSTLPASVTAFFKPSIGSAWLICGSFVSFIAAMASAEHKGDVNLLTNVFLPYSLPMLVLGLMAFLVIRVQASEEKIQRDAPKH